MDDLPVKFIISLLIPEDEAGTTHLTLLSTISRALVHEDMRKKLLGATEVDEIYQILKGVIGGD